MKSKRTVNIKFPWRENITNREGSGVLQHFGNILFLKLGDGSRSIYYLLYLIYIIFYICMCGNILLKINRSRTSLVAQWLRIHLPMQGTWVQSLVWEDSTCHRATKPVRHNYWACTLEPTSHNYWARTPRACAPQQEKPPQQEAHALQWRPNATKNKLIN